ncbi:MAG: riboflavin biosynthesis protein RibF [Planctomycetota bacterium]
MAVFAYSLNDAFPPACLSGAVSLGNFDGVHLGHRALLTETIRQARRLAGPAVAVTFDPPPAQILRPQLCQPLLTPVAYRSELLHAGGADHVIVFKTTPALLDLAAREFFDRILRHGLRANAVVEGFNFAFGKDRSGTGPLLQTWGREAGMHVALLDAQLRGQQPISSSRIRGLLLAGDVREANELLGSPYRLFGTVGLGNQRGRTLGFPTANLTTLRNLPPGPGVYAARVSHQGASWNAAAHLGPRPTFGDASPSVEIHLLNFTGDLYGLELAVDFVAKVREPRAFASVQELTQQIRVDIVAIESVLNS